MGGSVNINKGKLILVLGMQFLLALVFITGVGRSNPSTLALYHSYFADIAIPFSFYFLLSINDHQFEFLRPWLGAGQDLESDILQMRFRV